jgi:rRNA maturation endonuclease Nob1
MDTNFDEISNIKKTIRESMLFKDTDELIDIWVAHDTNDWTPEAFEVVGEILRDRGLDLDHLEDTEYTIPDEKDAAGSAQNSDTPGWVGRAVNMKSDEANRKLSEKSYLLYFEGKSREELDEKSTNELIKLLKVQVTLLNVIQEILAQRGVDAGEYIDSSKEYGNTLKCTSCDSDLPFDARFCPQCGMEIYPDSEAED